MARDKLTCWGFNYSRPSALHSTCNHLFVRIPGLDEVYPCIDFRDIMHGMKVFLPSHLCVRNVLGHSGHVLPPRLRDPMLTAIAHAQLLIIAYSGQRSYNLNELSAIFDEGWLTLFGALQRVHAVLHSMQVEKARNTNDELPTLFQLIAR